jgi:hypothetical protein
MPSSPIGSLMFVRLFRLWAAAREAGENPLPHMQDVVALIGPRPELAVACASLFELVEGQLGRHLVPECCCSAELSRDEQALLGVLRHAPEAGEPSTGAAVPHGLPGAICWAAFAIRRALGEGFAGKAETASQRGSAPALCPFDRAPQLAAAEGLTVSRARPVRTRSTDQRIRLEQS